MRVIQNELGEGDPHLQEVAALKVQPSRPASLPDEVREGGEGDLPLATMPSAPEVAVIRTYIDWLLELLGVGHRRQPDISHAAKVLEQSHYGLPKAKERILEHIAVHRLAADKMKNPILCFVGAGHGQDVAGQVDRRGPGRKFCASAWRHPRRGRDPRPSAHVMS